MMRWLVAAALLAAPAVQAWDDRADRASVTVRVLPESAPQGSIVQVVVHPQAGPGIRDLAATWHGRRVTGFSWTGGEARLLLPVGMDEAQGPARVRVEVLDRSGSRRVLDVPFTVVSGRFETDAFSVGTRFISPTGAQRAQARADQHAFEGLWARPAGERRWRGPFVIPLANRATGTFGTFRTLNGRVKSRHMGLDLDGETGEPVRAANDGKVVLLRDTFYAGKAVVVDHGGGLFTLYFHLSAADVQPGDGVRKGQVVGRVGASGRVTGPHLHWGVRLGGMYVNPAALMELDLAGDPRVLPVRTAVPRDDAPARGGRGM